MSKAEPYKSIVLSCLKGLIGSHLKISKSEVEKFLDVTVDYNLYGHAYKFRVYVGGMLAAERSLDAIALEMARDHSYALMDMADTLFDQAEPAIERFFKKSMKCRERDSITPLDIGRIDFSDYIVDDWTKPHRTLYETKTFSKMHDEYDDYYAYDLSDTTEGREALERVGRALKGAREAKALKEMRASPPTFTDSGVSLADELKSVLKTSAVAENHLVKPEHGESFQKRTTQENYERVVRALTEVNTTLALAELEPEKAALGTVIKRAGTTVQVVEGLTYTISPIRFSSLQNRLIVHMTTAGGGELHSIPLMEVLDCFPTFYDFISEELENTAMFDSWAELESHSIIIALDGRSMADALAEDISQGCNEAADAAKKAADFQEQQRLEQHAHYGNF